MTAIAVFTIATCPNAACSITNFKTLRCYWGISYGIIRLHFFGRRIEPISSQCYQNIIQFFFFHNHSTKFLWILTWHFWVTGCSSKRPQLSCWRLRSRWGRWCTAGLWSWWWRCRLACCTTWKHSRCFKWSTSPY